MRNDVDDKVIHCAHQEAEDRPSSGFGGGRSGGGGVSGRLGPRRL